MEWILVVVFGIGLLYYFIFKPGNIGFWRLAASHPDEVYALISQDREVWALDDPKLGFRDERREAAPSEWVGPFMLYVPMVDRTFKIYGRADRLEEAQAEISEILKANNLKPKIRLKG